MYRAFSLSPPDSSSSLLTRVTLCITGIEDGFKNLVALHQQVSLDLLPHWSDCLVCVHQALDGLQEEREGEGRLEGEGEERSECEQAMSAIATAVNSVKSQSVSMANKHRKRWRKLAQQKGSGSSLESSSSRESVEGAEKEVERCGEEAIKKDISEGRGDIDTGGGVAGSEISSEERGDMMKDPGILGLLDHYSQQLVELVRERTLHLPLD